MLSEFKYKIYNKNKWIKKLTDSKENNNLLKVNLINNSNKKDNSYTNASIIRDAYLRVMQICTYDKLAEENYLLLARTASVLILPNNYSDYLKLVGSKTRNMIKKAEKNNLYVEKIIWNEYLEDIYKINTSTNKRQGKEMKPHYSKFEKREEIYCNKYHFIDTIGCLQKNSNKDKLLGYLYLRCHNNCAIISRFLGHYEHKSLGVMNKLVSGTVNLLINNERYKHIKQIIYLVWDNTSLTSFKKRCGFKPYMLYFKNIQNFENFIKFNYNIIDSEFNKLDFIDLNYNRTKKLRIKENIQINTIKPCRSNIPLQKLKNLVNFNQEDIIIDVGSSHGFSTFFLSTLNVNKVIGIEILNLFYKKAIKNKKILKALKCEFIHCDFFDYNLPKNIKLFYIYNSFPYELIEKCITKLNEYIDKKKKVYILLKIRDIKVFNKYNLHLSNYNFKIIDEVNHINYEYGKFKSGSGTYYLYSK